MQRKREQQGKGNFLILMLVLSLVLLCLCQDRFHCEIIIIAFALLHALVLALLVKTGLCKHCCDVLDSRVCLRNIL